MSNREVFRAFASGRVANGGSVKSVAYGLVDYGPVTVLYSYGTPIAYYRDGKGTFTEMSYSATTSKHRGIAEREFPENNRKRVPHEVFRADLIVVARGVDLIGARP